MKSTVDGVMGIDGLPGSSPLAALPPPLPVTAGGWQSSRNCEATAPPVQGKEESEENEAGFKTEKRRSMKRSSKVVKIVLMCG
jgi:hypothetical protein